ncbi:uncharacterized protein LOC135085165 [Ostrinia nubilalis]|uniref:uncharacterized protein LOC135085165 n=1 Tax=Ostrinia nubilalis TaxID=29057 RepID=UPI003082617D
MAATVTEDEEFLSSHEILRENLKRRTRRRKVQTYAEPKCGECGKVLADKASLAHHIKTHNTADPYQCKKCPYKGKTQKYLTRHNNRVHGGKQKNYSCKYCGKLFLFKSGLVTHERVHTGEKPNVCDVCGKGFNSPYSLSTHRFIHSDEKPFKCVFCDYACRDSSTLRKHQERHMGIKKYPCDMCNKRFYSKYHLTAHMKENHIAPEDRNHACDKCEATFKNKRGLLTHKNLVHEQTKACICNVCGVRIPNKYNLSSHMRTHINVRPYKCAYDGCKASFKDKGTLKKHSVIHLPPQWVCGYCGRGFSRRVRLVRHIKLHEKPGAKTEACQYCGVRFLTKNYLTKHIRTKHAKDRQKYICDMCDFVTHNKPSIVMHIKYGHNYDNKTECKICGKIYKSKTFLKLHYKNTHNVSMKTKLKTLPNIQIKEEPMDPVPDLEIDLLDIEKEEPFTGYDAEYTDSMSAFDKEENERRLRVLFKKMIHDPDLEEHDDGITDQIDSAKEENKTEDTPDSPKNTKMPFEDTPQNTMIPLEDTPQNTTIPFEDTPQNTTIPSEDTLQNTAMLLEDTPMKTAIPLVDIQQNTAIPFEHTQQNTTIPLEDTPQNATMPFENSPQNSTIPFEDTLKNATMPFEDIPQNTSMSFEDIPQNTAMPLEELIQQDTLLLVVGDGQKTLQEQESSKNMLEEEIPPETPETVSMMEEMKQMDEEEKTEQSTPTPEDDDSTESTEMAENRTEDPPGPMPVEEFIQQVMGDMEDPQQEEEDDTYTLDKESEEFVRNRIRELLTNQRILDRESRIGFGRRTLKRISRDEMETSQIKPRVTRAVEPNTENIISEIKNKEKQARKEARKARREENKIKKKRKRKTKVKSDKDSKSGEKKTEMNNKYDPKLIFNMFQCNVCFKLFQTKPELMEHCQTHFDVCSDTMLMKCPLCDYVTERNIRKHMKTVHKEDVKISFLSILDRKETTNNSRYYYETKNDNAKELDIIPSIKILNKKAGMDLDRKNREIKKKSMSTSKLVKKGKEWIVETQKFDVSGYVLPNSSELDKNDVDYLKKLKKLGIEAKRKGVKMLYPCNKCEKVCQNLSAVTLHGRTHDPNKKPFRPKVWKHKTNNSNDNANAEKNEDVTAKINNRTAKPKPIVNKHKCDPKLKDFYEKNIRGLNIEFWQFLKIFNKMEREKINDFDDLKNSTEYGIGHVNYLYDSPSNSQTDNNTEKEINIKDNKLKNTNMAANKNKKLSVTSRNNSKVASKAKFTRTIRLSRFEHNRRMELQKKLREKIANTENTED